MVSPLISLMADQVRQLQALSISALLLNSSQDGAAYGRVVRQLREGFQGLLYISPERFAVPAFQELLQKIRPKLFVVDEAHCISAWGHDFRPDYMRLAEAREQLGSPLTIAVTATATAQVRGDISRVLKLRLPKVHVTGFDRENLAYGVRKFRSEAEKDAVLISLLGNIEGAAIVYCWTRRAVEQLAAWCEERFPGRPVCAYHAGLPQEARRASQELFVSGADTIVVATNALEWALTGRIFVWWHTTICPAALKPTTRRPGVPDAMESLPGVCCCTSRATCLPRSSSSTKWARTIRVCAERIWNFCRERPAGSSIGCWLMRIQAAAGGNRSWSTSGRRR